MKHFVFFLMALALIGLVGCSSDSGDEAQADAAATTTDDLRANLNEEAEIVTKPSGVRYQDLAEGDGVVVTDQMLVTYNYDVWFAREEGLVKDRMFHSTRRSQQAYFGQVGVAMLPGLSDGLIGMRTGGFRRIFVPSDLAYGDKPPFGGNDLIFEIYDSREASQTEVLEYKANYNNPEAARKRVEDGSEPHDHDHN